jgi:hypothetical protein
MSLAALQFRVQERQQGIQPFDRLRAGIQHSTSKCEVNGGERMRG